MKNNLNGITIDGVPAKEILDDTIQEERDEILIDVKNEFKKKYHPYKPTRNRYVSVKQRRTKVEHKIFEMNKANLVTNIQESITENNTHKALISIIFTTESAITNNEIFDIFEKYAPKNRQFAKTQYSFRNAIGSILQSDIGQYIEVTEKKPGVSTKYRVLPEHQNSFSVNELVSIYMKTRKTRKHEQTKQTKQTEQGVLPNTAKKTNQIASFKISDANGTSIDFNIFGKIQFEFIFKFSK